MRLDDTLLDALRMRDPNAQARLEDAFRDGLVARARREVDDPALAEDIVADLLLEFLYDKVDRLRSPRAIPTYLRVAVVDRSRREARRRRRAQPLPTDLGTAHPEDALNAHLDAPALHTRLDDCLAGLTARARAMLRLRFRHEHTNRSIGEALGISGQHVGRIIAAALTRLRRCME